jgi:hypothetical protein
MKARLLLLPIAAAALAAGCATGPRVQTGADVTRFHLGQPIARGSIAIEPLRAEEGGSLQFSQIAAAVGRLQFDARFTAEDPATGFAPAVVAVVPDVVQMYAGDVVSIHQLFVKGEPPILYRVLRGTEESAGILAGLVVSEAFGMVAPPFGIGPHEDAGPGMEEAQQPEESEGADHHEA